MQFILPEKLQVHQFCKKVGLASPFFQSDEARAFPVKIGDSSGADSNILSSGCIFELNDLKIIGMSSLLKIAKLIAESSFFFDELNKIFGRKSFLDGLSSLFQFREPFSIGFELLRIIAREIHGRYVCFQFFGKNAFLCYAINFLEFSMSSLLLHQTCLLSHKR